MEGLRRRRYRAACEDGAGMTRLNQTSMLRAPQIFVTLGEGWDFFKCGDYEAGAEVCGH